MSGPFSDKAPVDLSYKILAQIVAKSLTLYERIGRTDLEFLATSPDKIKRRRDEWRKNCARGDEQEFQRRLREDGLEPDFAERLLYDVQLSADVELPIWSGFLRDALAASEKWDEETIFRPHDQHGEFPFYPLLRPFIEYAFKLVDARLVQGGILPTPNVLDGTRANLVRLLTKHAALVFHLEFTIFKASRETGLDALLRRSQGVNSQRWFREFVMRFYRGGWSKFFVEYSVLARQIACSTMNWVDASVEMLSRLSVDRELLSRQFANGAELGELLSIEAGVSDRHNSGRTTAILGFSSGVKVVYKPKPLNTDLLMAELVAWINRRDSLLPLKSVSTLNRGSYGWQAFVSHDPCADQLAVQRFYRRSGYQLALIYVLEGYDCHHENIIAAGEYPCLIDTETIFNPYKEMLAVTLGKANAATLASKEVFYSVMRTGMLPNWSVQQQGRKRDTSGFGGGSVDANDNHVSSGWVSGNSDDVRLEMRSVEVAVMANLPYISPGMTEPADDYVAEIQCGFRDMYQFISRYQSEFIDLISGRRDISVRFVRRATNLYVQQMWTLSNAEFLRDGLDWNIELEKMGNALLAGQGANKAIWRLLPEEYRSMMELDVPYFKVYTDSLDVVGGNCDVVVSNYFSIPCFDRLSQKLDKLNVADQALQERYIAYAFYARAAESYHEGNEVHRPLKASTTHLAPVEALECIRVAEEIARELMAEALNAADGSTAWIALEYIKEADAFQFKPISYNFYAGGIGLAFFLAALSKVTGNAEYQRAAESAAQPILTVLERELDIVLAFSGVGGGVGIGSVIYALAAIAEFDRTSAFSQAALTIALDCLQKIDAALLSKDSKLDLIFGTAGLLLGLVKLYRVTADPAVQSKIKLAADHLLANRVANADGRLLVPTLESKVVTGISHGIAGIALALMRAYQVTGDDKYRHSAMEHVSYEESRYDADANNYPDYRSRGNQSSFMTCWCHGAPGIGLSRLAMHMITGDKELIPQIEKNMHQTSTYTLEHLDHICCGNMGRIDIQLEYARQFGDHELMHRLRQDTAYVLERYRRNDGFRMFINSPNKVFSPGLFVGATGIAYSLLRLADPHGLPCVLAFE